MSKYRPWKLPTEVDVNVDLILADLSFNLVLEWYEKDLGRELFDEEVQAYLAKRKTKKGKK